MFSVTANNNESQVVFKVDRAHETTIVHDLRAEKCLCGETDVAKVVGDLTEQLAQVTRKLDTLLAKTPGRLEGF
jgi:hypothetical protein